MTRLTAQDFPAELLEFYDYYAHGKITKRQFLDLAAKYAVGGVTAIALLGLMSPDYALAQQVEFTDPDIVAEYITYPSPTDTAACAVIWCVRPTPPDGSPAWWSPMRTGDLTPILRMWRAASPRRDLSRWRLMD